MLDLHPDAASRFNERAEELSQEAVTTNAPPEQPEMERETTSSAAGPSSQSATFAPDVHIKGVFTQRDIIGTPRVGKVDSRGNTVAYMFRKGEQECWIEGDGYRGVIRLAESIQRCPPVRDVLSRKTIEEAICDWIEKRVTEQAVGPLIDFLRDMAGGIIEELELILLRDFV